jgi:hypothetical protein
LQVLSAGAHENRWLDSAEQIFHGFIDIYLYAHVKSF